MQAPTLTKDYAELLQRGKVETYLKQLAENGLRWWFNMELPCLILHLEAVRNHLPAALPDSLKLRFLCKAIGPDISEAAMSTLYEQALTENDIKTAIANCLEMFHHLNIKNCIMMKPKARPWRLDASQRVRGKSGALHRMFRE